MKLIHNERVKSNGSRLEFFWFFIFIFTLFWLLQRFTIEKSEFFLLADASLMDECCWTFVVCCEWNLIFYALLLLRHYSGSRISVKKKIRLSFQFLLLALLNVLRQTHTWAREEAVKLSKSPSRAALHTSMSAPIKTKIIKIFTIFRSRKNL